MKSEAGTDLPRHEFSTERVMQRHHSVSACKRRENEELEMLSTSKLVEDLMKRDGLTADLMAEQTGKPVQHVIEIIKHVRDITEDDALLFERRLGWSAIELLDHQTRDLLARNKTQTEILKIWSKLLKLGFEILKLKPRVEKFEALVEKICRAPQPSKPQVAS